MLHKSYLFLKDFWNQSGSIWRSIMVLACLLAASLVVTFITAVLQTMMQTMDVWLPPVGVMGVIALAAVNYLNKRKKERQELFRQNQNRKFDLIAEFVYWFFNAHKRLPVLVEDLLSPESVKSRSKIILANDSVPVFVVQLFKAPPKQYDPQIMDTMLVILQKAISNFITERGIVLLSLGGQNPPVVVDLFADIGPNIMIGFVFPDSPDTLEYLNRRRLQKSIQTVNTNDLEF